MSGEQAVDARAASAPERDLTWWLEVAATTILLIGSLVTAWCALEASRWGSVQATGYAQAGSQRSQWIAAQSLAAQYALYDVVTFASWSEAMSENNTALAAFHERRFREEFRPAFEAWMAMGPLTNPDAPPSPLTMPEYSSRSLEQARAFDETAQAMLRKGEEANTWNTRYVTHGFFGALAIYFAGMSPRFKQRSMRILVTVAGAVLLIYAIVQVAGFPVA